MPETQSDSEYHIPFSPSINRSRIKAIPKLGQRKTSFSASESEDETRKYCRIRNNSVCSVASTTGPTLEVATSDITSPSKDSGALKKITIKTDQSRKLAEARKEFNKRFGAANPDKQKLRMIDLIFYNPLTNPLTKEEIENKLPSNESQEVELEQQVDEPDEKKSDENGPAPQIKIGPSGEIIVDEQSLVVENTALIKQREKIENSQAFNASWDTSYGVYKKTTRAKEWNHKETLRFYKVLNLIGSDFTVMTELFPKRTRRELKMKFKKEEKINKHLIDKALMEPCNYNFNDLKREIEIEDEEDAILEKLRQEELKKVREKKKRMPRKRRGTCDTASSIDPEERTSKRIKMKPINIQTVLNDWDADVSDIETQSENEDDDDHVTSLLKPTRSGRIPRIAQRFSSTNNHEYQTSALKEKLDESQLAPGALILVALDNDKQNDSEKYKVLMVTDQKELVPVDIESNIIEQLIKSNHNSKMILINDPKYVKM